jgi:Rhodopirellula transposase DDE domain
MNAQADADPTVLRISMDTKATVNVGEYSRGGQSRARIAVAALDHDMQPKEKLVPGGILESVSGRPFVFFGNSYKTSDFMVDGLLLWWEERKSALSNIKQLMINLDNGPECSGHRSQFLLRMTEFADQTGLSVRLVYYPPYHSKYNGIERYWAGLEKSWNGYLLDSVTTVLNRARNFMWKGMRTTAIVLGTTYKKGVKVCTKEKKRLEARLQRDPTLHWWDITINHKMV